MLYYKKIYIDIYLLIDTNGIIKPIALKWINGKKYKIDEIKDVRNQLPKHVGGVLTRKYTVLIEGKIKEIYLETQTNKWFIEKLINENNYS